MKKIFVFLLSLSVGVYASELAIIFDKILHEKSIASSYLIEKRTSTDFYSADKAFDKNKDTCWCKGTNGDGIGQYIWFKLTKGTIPDYDEHKNINITIDFINGVAKNEKLFKENNRIKKAVIEVYESKLRISQGGVFRDNEPKLNSSIEIELKDEIAEQKIVLKLKPKFQPEGSSKFGSFAFVGKLIIKEIYKGDKYSDTCISEIKVHSIE